MPDKKKYAKSKTRKSDLGKNEHHGGSKETRKSDPDKS